MSNMSHLKYEFLLVKSLTKFYKLFIIVHNTIPHLYQLIFVIVGYINELSNFKLD